MSGHLWQIIQEHLDAYGVREAEFARRIGTSPQTVNSWKKRGVRSLPDKALLVGVSEVTRRPYDEVLTAVLFDISYLPKENDRGNTTPTTRAEVSSAHQNDYGLAARRGDLEEPFTSQED